jgi:hypothetical protein
VTGTSVLGIKYKDGVLLAADTAGSSFSLSFVGVLLTGLRVGFALSRQGGFEDIEVDHLCRFLWLNCEVQECGPSQGCGEVCLHGCKWRDQ